MTAARYLSLRLLRALEHAGRAHDVISSVAEELLYERSRSLAGLGAQAYRIDAEVTRLLSALRTAESMADAAARAEEQIETAGNPAGDSPAAWVCAPSDAAGGGHAECSAIPPSQQPARDRAIQGAPAAQIESRGTSAASPSVRAGVGAGGNHEVGR